MLYYGRPHGNHPPMTGCHLPKLALSYPAPTFVTRFTVMEKSQPLHQDSVQLPHHQKRHIRHLF